MEFYYRLYGLSVCSEIELPEAYEINPQIADVTIRYGEMPDHIKKKKVSDCYSSTFLRDYKWFYFDQEGSFLIENGNKITVEPDLSADDKHIRSLILGACFGSILYQREAVAMHGAAVVWRNKAIIISGVSGAGKSTVSTQFRKMGCKFMADDTVAVTVEGDSIYAIPAYPQQKLCSDAAIEFGYNLKDLILLGEDRDKYAVRLKDAFCPESKEIAALVSIDRDDAEELSVREVDKSQKLECILANLYSFRDFQKVGMNSKVFRKCLEIARNIAVIKVKRPMNKKLVPEITEQIIAILDRKYNYID